MRKLPARRILAENDADGIRMARDIVGMLGWNKATPRADFTPSRSIRPTTCSAWCPATAKALRHAAKSSPAWSMTPTSSTSRPNTTTRPSAAGRIGGFPIGIIGNNGPITPQGAAKASQFIQLCDQTNAPPLCFCTTPPASWSAPSRTERRHQTRFEDDSGRRQRPRAEVVTRHRRLLRRRQLRHVRSRLDPRFIFSWPNSKTAVMGGAQAGKVLRIVTEAKQAKMGIKSNPKCSTSWNKSTAAKTGRTIHRPVQYRQPV
jgi:geranyl-CoA carboxylase beta subunit